MRVGARPGRALPARRRFLGALAVAACAGASCYSPTLPLPPPVAPDISMTETGAFRASGHVLSKAQVFCVNVRSGAIDGQWVGEDGYYAFTLTDARHEDPMQIWYQAGTELSPTTFFNLPEAPEDDPSAGGMGAGGGAGAGGAP